MEGVSDSTEDLEHFQSRMDLLKEEMEVELEKLTADCSHLTRAVKHRTMSTFDQIVLTQDKYMSYSIPRVQVETPLDNCLPVPYEIQRELVDSVHAMAVCCVKIGATPLKANHVHNVNHLANSLHNEISSGIESLKYLVEKMNC